MYETKTTMRKITENSFISGLNNVSFFRRTASFVPPIKYHIFYQ